MDTKSPLLPFTAETAARKVRLAKDAWDARDCDRVVHVRTQRTRWRHRAEFAVGAGRARAFLRRRPADRILLISNERESPPGSVPGGSPRSSPTCRRAVAHAPACTTSPAIPRRATTSSISWCPARMPARPPTTDPQEQA